MQWGEYIGEEGIEIMWGDVRVGVVDVSVGVLLYRGQGWEGQGCVACVIAGVPVTQYWVVMLTMVECV